VNDGVYHYSEIGYIVEDEVVVSITGMAVMLPVQEQEQEPVSFRMRRFDVFLDPAPLVERFSVVAWLKAAQARNGLGDDSQP
jgi:hypothetical protein